MPVKLQMRYPMKKIAFLLLLILCSFAAKAQLGFCSGAKGIPIFTETFGNGLDEGPALPPGTISYLYDTGRPTDGEYNIYWLTNFSPSWHNVADHSPDATDGPNGKMLIINASLLPETFYRRVVGGLCANTTFEFSAWVMNIYNPATGPCSGTGNPVDVTFEIWDITETNLIATGNTNAINGTTTPIWNQYAIVFTMPPGQTDVVLKMRNNGAGGCGNDLAIDDIAFNACGDNVTITSPVQTAPGVFLSQCVSSTAMSVTMNAVPASGLSLAYQWQQSTDNVNWSDIPGATSSSYTTAPLLVNTYFRAKSAQNAANLVSSTCSIVSSTFSVLFTPKPLPPVSLGDQTICAGELIPPLSVTVGAVGETVSWYTTATGGTPVAANTLVYTPTVAGTYYAEAHTASCKSDTRTAVTLTVKISIVLGADETIHICKGDSAILDAGDPTATYVWQPGGETTQTITVSASGVYTVTGTSTDGCTDVKSFTVFVHEDPVISSIVIDDGIVTVYTQGDPNYEYAMDTGAYQSSNVFNNLEGGYHTAHVRDASGCGDDSLEFLMLYIPKYFTPNNDAYNDFWEIQGMIFVPGAQVAIFDRYGKLLTMLTTAQPRWDGKYNGRELPSTDYWYLFTRPDAPEKRGHFSLKR